MEREIRIDGRYKKSVEETRHFLEQLGFSTQIKNHVIHAEKIESRDVRGNPLCWYKVEIHPREFRFTYSFEKGDLNRMNEGTQMLINTCRAISECYEVGLEQVFDEILHVLESLSNTADKELGAVLEEKERLQEQLIELQNKYSALLAQNEQNVRILLECEKLRDEYRKKIEQYERLSDEELELLIYQYLKNNHGEISITQFCTRYHLPQTRVEQALNKLIKKGYIQRVG